jgi:hypothetical protein
MEGKSMLRNKKSLRQEQQDPHRHNQAMQVRRQSEIPSPKPMPKIIVA